MNNKHSTGQGKTDKKQPRNRRRSRSKNTRRPNGQVYVKGAIGYELMGKGKSRYQEKEEQRPRPEQKQSKSSEGKTDLPVSGTVNGDKKSDGYSLGTPVAFSQIIHPSNQTLFPTVGQIWRSFQRYRITNMVVNARPLSSTLASGAYVMALRPDASDSIQGPAAAFATLINYTASTLATIWQPVAFKWAGGILHRLGSYLMDGADWSTTSPGTFDFALSDSAMSGLGQSSAIPPLLQISGVIQMSDFVPATEPAPIGGQVAGYLALTGPVVSPGMIVANCPFQKPYNVPTSFTWTPNLNTSKPYQWGTISGFSGLLQMVITQQSTARDRTVGRVVINSTSYTPITVQLGSSGSEASYSVPIAGSGTLSLPTFSNYVATSDDFINGFSVSFFIPGHTGVQTFLYRRHLHTSGAVRQFMRTQRATGDPIPRCLAQVHEEEQEVDQYHQPDVFLSHASLSRVLEKIAPEPFVPFIPEGKDFCWARALRDVGVSLHRRGDELLAINQATDAQWRGTVRPVMAVPQFIRCVAKLGVEQALSKTVRIIDSGEGLCHLQKRLVPRQLPIPEFLEVLGQFLEVGGYPSFKQLATSQFALFLFSSTIVLLMHGVVQLGKAGVAALHELVNGGDDSEDEKPL